MNTTLKKSAITLLMIFILFMIFTNTISASEVNLSDEELNLNTIDSLGLSDEIYVNNNVESSGDGSINNPFKSIKEAVDTSNRCLKPITIYISSGTYTETNMTLKNNLTITNYNNGNVILNANKKGWFFYSNNINNSLTLNGLVFHNGNNYNYDDSTVGGVVKTEGHLDVVNCTFSYNYGGTGGGIYSHNGANIINSTFKNNRAEYSGGGLYVYGSQTNIINCTFDSNTAKRQGGAVRTQGNLNIENSTFKNNYAGTGNYAGNGGAVRVTNGNLTVYNSVFNNNSAKFEGGAISAGDDSQYSTVHYDVWIDKSIFVNNKARSGAGIIANDGLTLTNSILSNNTVPKSVSARYGLGAGIYVLNGKSVLVGNIIENNTNPFNKLETEDIYIASGKVSEKNNKWGENSKSRIKVKKGTILTEFEYEERIKPKYEYKIHINTKPKVTNKTNQNTTIVTSNKNENKTNQNTTIVTSNKNENKTNQYSLINNETRKTSKNNKNIDLTSKIINKTIDITKNAKNIVENYIKKERYNTTTTIETLSIGKIDDITNKNKNEKSSTDKSNTYELNENTTSKSSNLNSSTISIIILIVITILILLLGYYRNKNKVL